MSERQKGLRTIYTEEQREFFVRHSFKYSKREWAFIMDTDLDGVSRLKARYGVCLRYRDDEENSINDLIRIRNQFEFMDWDRRVSKVIQDKHKKMEDKKVVEAKIAIAKRHNPDDIQERLRLNGMTISWREYVERLHYLYEVD